jgi:hypothetical protein
MIPVKPGESVWLFFETPELHEPRAYWLSRISNVDHVEDVNFTHDDRKFNDALPVYGPPDGDVERLLPTLQNGPHEWDTEFEKLDLITLSIDEELMAKNKPKNPFEVIRESALEKNMFNIEPVPRLTKRPGDFVLQGSNNTAIILGTDRGWTVKERPKKDTKISNASTEEKLPGLAGSIDIVAGRGRNFSKKTLEDTADADPEITRARVIKNKEEDFETDKNTATDPDKTALVGDDALPIANLLLDPVEGDPDFINDASRVYVSMKSSVDEQLGVTVDLIPTAYDKDPKKSGLQDASSVAAVAIKSDEIRLVARRTQKTTKKQEPGDTPEINGSIRIIKEGKKKEDSACIYLLPDGTIQISGSKIMIGRSPDDDGTAKHETKTVGKSEPYMRYTEFAKWGDGLIDAINEAFKNNQKATNSNGDKVNAAASAGTAGGAGPGFGSPNSALGAAFGQMTAPSGMSGMYDHAPDKKTIDDYKSDGKIMPKIKSKRVFGE